VLFLQFQLGEERYALETAHIVEVLPLLRIKDIPHAPRGVPGIFSYRGAPVPAIDLSVLILGRPAEHLLSTRLVLIQDTGAGAGKTPRLLGLIAERATETVHLDAEAFTLCGVGGRDATYLGPVAKQGDGFIQRILTDKLLAGTVRDALYELSSAVA
jgi:chemotaxis-related protein WspB